jgi:predicted TIM-barrel fold metal-dependent hydrolase
MTTRRKLISISKIVAALILGCGSLSGYAQDRYEGPIIDMHLHARSEVQAKQRLCFPRPCDGAPTIAKDVTEMREMLLANMAEHNIVLGVISGGDPKTVLDWVGDKESLFLAGVADPSRYSTGELYELYVDGEFSVLGEMAEQYDGIAIDDPSLDHVFSFANEHDIPILIHLGGLGGSTDFPTHLGNPLSLTPVLRKYPDLRVYLENASWPFLEEITALMYVYPNVYADVSTILHLTPRPQALRYLKGLFDNGLGERVMYGSDQMSWPEVIPIVIDAIQTADFLTKEQKADIFYNNAARFLELSEAEIAGHHVSTPQ